MKNKDTEQDGTWGEEERARVDEYERALAEEQGDSPWNSMTVAERKESLAALREAVGAGT